MEPHPAGNAISCGKGKDIGRIGIYSGHNPEKDTDTAALDVGNKNSAG